MAYIWNYSKESPEEYWVLCETNSGGNVMLAGEYPGRLYKSTDFGSTWAETQPAGDVSGNWIDGGISDNGSVMVVSNNGGRMYVSQDVGSTWAETQPVGASNKSWYGTDINSTGSSMVAVVASYDRAYLTTDVGNSWAEIRPSGDNDYIWICASMNGSGDRVVIANRDFIEDSGRIYYSQDTGSNWTDITPSGEANTIWAQTDIDQLGNTIIAANENQVYFTKDAGSNWSSSSIFEYGNKSRGCSVSQNGSVLGVSRYMPTDNSLYISRDFGSTWGKERNSSTQSDLDYDGKVVLSNSSSGLDAGTYSDKYDSPITMQLSVNGQVLEDVLTANVVKKAGDSNSSSQFSATFNNYFGRIGSKFNIGDNVTITVDRENISTPIDLFNGTIENIKHSGYETDERITILGRDYTSILQDNVVLPESYNNQYAGSIAIDVVKKYAKGLTTNNISVGSYIISGARYRYVPVFDVLQDLADKSSSSFYVDTNKDVNFHKKSTYSSNSTFDSGNVLKSVFREDRNDLYNEIWVRGGNYLTNYNETTTAGSPVGGSVYTLLYNPHSTEVTVDGVAQAGGVYEFGNVVSGTNYLVAFDDKQIIFTSGTSIGDSIPSSGASLVFNYDRSLPVIGVAQDSNSKSLYGRRTKIISDKNIKSPIIANATAQQELLLSANPRTDGTIQVKGIIEVDPTETCIVNLPFEGISNQTYDIIEADYNFNKKAMLAAKVLTLQVNSSVTDITDKIKDLYGRINRLETSDTLDADIETHQETVSQNFTVIGSNWTIWGGSVTGSVSYCYSTNFVPPVSPLILGSATNQGVLAGSFTGSAVSHLFTKLASGGQF